VAGLCTARPQNLEVTAWWKRHKTGIVGKMLLRRPRLTKVCSTRQEEEEKPLHINY
jgi:hypothetical protein